MIFTAAPLNENFDLGHWVSETGSWDFGLRRVLYGVRICASKGEEYFVVDYCAGADAGHITFIRSLVQAILEGLPESVTAGAVEQLMPKWTRRPIHKDQDCLDALILLAGQALKTRHGKQA